MNIYVQVVANILWLAFSFGFVLPFLISASSSVLVFAGWLYLLFIPVIFYRVNRNYIQYIMRNSN